MEYVHINEITYFLPTFFVPYDDSSHCNVRAQRHELLYILSCRDDEYFWEVPGDCIKFKYKKDDEGNWISKLEEIPKQIPDEMLREYGKVYFPKFELHIGKKK